MADINHTLEPDKTQQAHFSLQQEITQVLQSKGATDIVEIDLAGKSDIADAMIIASGTSTTHIDALAHYMVELFKKSGVTVLSVEGRPANKWILVDTAEIIVHIFHPETRGIYNLEKMWGISIESEKKFELLH